MSKKPFEFWKAQPSAWTARLLPPVGVARWHDKVMRIYEAELVAEQLKPAHRCPDFDGDCKGVKSHINCWTGISADGKHNIGQADGYCPYVIGQLRR